LFFLDDIDFYDIKGSTPLKLPDKEYEYAVNRWFTIQIEKSDKHQIIPIVYQDINDPLSFLAATEETAKQPLLFNIDPENTKQTIETGVPDEHIVAVELIKDAFTKLNSPQKTGKIEVMEPVHMVYATTINPHDDTYYDTRGAWGQTDYDDLYGIKQIQSEAAWELSDGEGVVVAVVDSGVDYNHEDLAENMWTNFGESGIDAAGNDKRNNNVDDDNNGYFDDWLGLDVIGSEIGLNGLDTDPMDDLGHGTHVAGTIAAVDNNIGVIGVAPRAKIMAVKGLDEYGRGDTVLLAEAIRYAADNQADIINNSWGGMAPYFRGQLYDAFNYAVLAGAINIASAGNNNLNVSRWPVIPANYENTISVAATDWSDTKASFSNYDNKTQYDVIWNHDLGWIDVAAPGAAILSLRANETDLYLGSENYQPGSNFVPVEEGGEARYYRASGTSMAAPHVSGVAALIKTRNPEYTNDEVREVLRNSTDPINSPEYIGTGRINAHQAADSMSPMVAKLTSPYPGPQLINIDVNKSPPAVEKVVIKGTASGKLVKSYVVEVGVGNNPISWTQENITLAEGNGLSPVEDGILATWDISELPPETYHIRLRVLDSLGNSSESIIPNLVVDRTIHEGWPKDVSDFIYPWWDNNYLAIGNTNNDFKGKEIIINSPLDSGGAKVMSYSHEGGLLPGWPINVNELPLHANSIVLHNSPVLADLDANSEEEILFYASTPLCWGKTVLYILLGDGSLFNNWAKEGLGCSGNGMPAVSDINDDKIRDIIFSSLEEEGLGEGNFYAWDTDGVALSGWPKQFNVLGLQNSADNSPKWSTTIVDINGEKNIFHVFHEHIRNHLGDLTAYNSYVLRYLPGKNEISPGWPIKIEDNWVHDVTVAIGNVIGNKEPEIVVINRGDYNFFEGYMNGSIRVYNLNGEAVSPWPKVINRYYLFGPNPTLVDVDDDNLKEIIIGWHAFNGDDGSQVEGWPQVEENLRGEDGETNVFQDSVVVVDVDGDGVVEIITVGPQQIRGWVGSLPRLYAFKLDGSQVEGWPKTLPEYPLDKSRASPVADDIDGDGNIEVAVALYGGIVTVYDTPGLASAGTWPMVHKDAQHRRGYYPPGTLVKNHIFYNNSSFDNNDPAINDRDKYAIAPDKQALKPGQTASFRNYTSYSRGINGIMIDINDPSNGSNISANDFVFKVGNSDDPGTWTEAPAPNNVSIEPFMGTDQSDRITITWDDNVIQKQWLQVTVKATENTGLSQDKIFYYGNAIGETGSPTDDANVTTTDLLNTRNNPRDFTDPALLNFDYDFNRDSKVDATDVLTVRNNQTSFFDSLKLITAP
jgi:subtilisin family serine protease